MRAVVLTFDRLPLHELGCYGNLRADTPNFDRLAAEAVTFDSHFAEHVSEQLACQAWWRGHYTFPRADAWAGATLPAVLKSHGVETRCICEAPEQLGKLLDDFSTAVTLDAADAVREGLPNAEQLVDEAIRQLRTLKDSPRWLLWLHARGLPPSPDESEQQPAVSETMTALDEGLGRLLAAVKELESDEELLFVVTAARGDLPPYPAVIQQDARPLAEPRVHTPLLARLSSADRGRRRSFVQTVDLAPTLLDWFQRPPESMRCEGRSWLPALGAGSEDPRAYVCYGDTRGAAIRTADFCLVADDLEAAAQETSGPHGVRLFVKPDDFWEVDDAAAQFPEQAIELLQILQQFVAAARQELPMQVPRWDSGEQETDAAESGEGAESS